MRWGESHWTGRHSWGTVRMGWSRVAGTSAPIGDSYQFRLGGKADALVRTVAADTVEALRRAATAKYRRDMRGLWRRRRLPEQGKARRDAQQSASRSYNGPSTRRSGPNGDQLHRQWVMRSGAHTYIVCISKDDHRLRASERTLCPVTHGPPTVRKVLL